LGHGHFLARAVALVELPGRVHGEQAPDLDLVRHLAELDLHALAVGEPDAETFAPRHVVLRDLHAALRPAEPAHAVGQARRAEPDLRHPQPVADTEQHVIVGNLQPVEFELAVAAVLLRTHDPDAPHDAPAGLIAVIEERGEPAPLVLGRARHDDEMLRRGGAGDEPLAPAYDPLVALALRARGDHAGIGAAARRRLAPGEGRLPPP